MKTVIDVVKSAIPSSVRYQLKDRSRMLTSWMRIMPDFVIIGAQKCGTSSLYRYLAVHPYVRPAFKKEVHFFDYNYEKGISWYRANFPTAFSTAYLQRIAKHNFITGEASPYYIFHPHSPKRVHEMLPNAKLILLLRNPVDRAYSHYHHEVRQGYETLSFEGAIRGEEARLYGELEKILEDENYYSINYRHYSYLARGVYIDQLKRWKKFFPDKQILILKSEDFFNNPPSVMSKVLEFLGLPDWHPNTYKKYNDGGNYGNMDLAMREYLIDYFAPHNKRLYEGLSVNFGWNEE